MAPVDAKSPLLQRAESMAKEFDYPAGEVRKGVREFLRLMDEGLQHDGAAMTMIPTYVTAVPNGTEKGIYLAVDLGGTNFRVCSVTLKGDTTFDLVQSKSAIPRDLMVGDSHSLFSFLAREIEKFVRTHHSDHFTEDPRHNLQLGFTFSFPVNQKAVNRGYLIRWTKGFDIKDAIGKDVCALLQAEIDTLGLPVKVAALVNDTVGTLMARSYTSHDTTKTLIGAIFGTGTNGAYVEKLARISKMTAPGADFGVFDTSTGEMVVNTEWGSFDNEMKVLPDTPYDRALDAVSVNPGIQMFEKRVSGMFLGEILRHAILALKSETSAFSTSQIPESANLFTAWSVDTSVLSFIEADDSEDLAKAKSVLAEQLGIPSASTEEARAVKALVHAIGKRSARLSAVPIAAIIIGTSQRAPQQQPTSIMGRIRSVMSGNPPRDEPSTSNIIDIGVDGSVVEFYPNFEGHLRSALRDVEEVGELGEKRIRMGIARDGSGVGAALIALVAATSGSKAQV